MFEHLAHLAAVANLSEADRVAYDKAVDSYKVSRIVEEDIRREGREEGLKKGMREGMKEATKDLVLQMNARGMSTADIIKYTGLSRSEIEAIIQK